MEKSQHASGALQRGICQVCLLVLATYLYRNSTLTCVTGDSTRGSIAAESGDNPEAGPSRTRRRVVVLDDSDSDANEISASNDNNRRRQQSDASYHPVSEKALGKRVQNGTPGKVLDSSWPRQPPELTEDWSSPDTRIYLTFMTEADLLSIVEDVVVEDEHAAEADPFRDDDDALPVNEGTASWIELWATVLHLFRVPPHNLFRWGLRLDLKLTSEEHEVLWSDLSELLTHPFWDGKLYLVRYFLQKAICLRVTHHADPLCPLPDGARRIVVEHRSDLARSGFGRNFCNTAASILSYNLWEMFRPETQGAGRMLSRATQRLAHGSPCEAASSSREERVFFLLRRDVILVRDALDSLRGEWPFNRTVWSYTLAYSRAVASAHRSPSHAAQVTNLDRSCAAGIEREKAAGMPDVPKDERLLHGTEWYWQNPTCDDRFRKTVYLGRNRWCNTGEIEFDGDARVEDEDGANTGSKSGGDRVCSPDLGFDGLDDSCDVNAR